MAIKESRTISMLVDKDVEKVIKDLGDKVLLTGNVSHIIRYALKFTHRHLLEDNNEKDNS